jgi:hypothetical protein
MTVWIQNHGPDSPAGAEVFSVTGKAGPAGINRVSSPINIDQARDVWRFAGHISLELKYSWTER